MMGKLTEADEEVHKELLASLKTIRCTVHVKPHILENRTEGELSTHLGVRITCGTDSPRERLWVHHRGQREGDDWEKAKRLWRHLYEYVRDYIGAIAVLGGVQLADEIQYLRMDQEGLEKIFETSADLARLYKAMGSVREAGVPFDSEFQMWIGQYAGDVQTRLMGHAKANIGSNSKLRFSPAEMTDLLEVLDFQRTLWQRARDVFWANQDGPNWQELVRIECARLGGRGSVDDDLLDAISARTREGEFRYRPSQVALVAAARYASIDQKESWYSPPGIEQHKTIDRAVTEWRKRSSEAKEFRLRW